LISEGYQLVVLPSIREVGFNAQFELIIQRFIAIELFDYSKELGQSIAIIEVSLVTLELLKNINKVSHDV
jgi:hypothetical protein